MRQEIDSGSLLIATFGKKQDIYIYFLMAILQNGTVVSFSISEGYPPTVNSYKGVITRWNGASYDIRVGDKIYYTVPESDVVVLSLIHI